MVPPEVRERFIQEQRAHVLRHFPETWTDLTCAWNQPGAEDCAWLMYSANYLFRTHGARWAMDPIRLEHRLPGAPSVDYARDLANLSFVVLTHQHADHLDIELIRSLSRLPITWIVPQPLLSRLVEQAGVPDSAIIVPRALQPIHIQGLRLTPFDAMHWEKQSSGRGLRGVPEVGYLVEAGGRRWLFPGDTRTYDASLLPAFGPVDALFAHIWLGRGAAGQAPPPLLEAFCRFCLDLQPRRVILTHIQEFGRSAEEHWDESHARLACERLAALRPGLAVEYALMGAQVSL